MVMPRIHPKSSKVSSALDVMMLLPKNPSFDKKRTHSLLQQKSLSENHLQCILSYFTSPTLKRKSLQRRIEVTPASELCMQVHYFFVVVASRGHKKRGKVGEASSTNPFWLLVPQPWWWGPSSNNFMSWIFALMFTPQISVKKQKLCHLLSQKCNMQKGSSCWEIPQDKWVSQLNMVFPQYTVQKGGPFWKIPKLIWYGCHFGGRIEYSWPSSLSCSSCCFGWN